jgi:diaminopimelate epimerase
MKKLHGCKNSFLVLDEIKGEKVEDRKEYVIKRADKEGVDGVLFVTKSSSLEVADLEMVIYDRDGTLEDMCGNGIRCFARYSYDQGYIKENSRILTGDGVKEVSVSGDIISVNMGMPKDFKTFKDNLYFARTGLPHFVSFTENLDLEKANKEGRIIRYNKNICGLAGYPEGMCVNFVKIDGTHNLSILTYEVGVERVTNACGTGSTASAYVSNVLGHCEFPITVRNIGGELLIDVKKGRLIMKGNAEYL